MSVQGALTEVAIRNQLLLEMLKEGDRRGFARFIRAMEKDIRSRLLDEGDIIENKVRLRRLIVDLRSIQSEVLGEYREVLDSNMEALAVDQAEIEAESYAKVVKNFEPVIPPAQKLVTAYKVNPMTMQNFAGDQILDSYIKDFDKRAIQRITNVVRNGFSRGATITDMVTEIRGTKALKFADGEIAKIDRDNRAIVRTAYQHVANQARQETMKANSDIVDGYVWVSAIDSKTSDICRGLDGRFFELGKGPLPPQHPNERSTTVARLKDDVEPDETTGVRLANLGEDKGEISEKSTYYQVLKRQPKKIRDEILGPTRSKLLSDGGITADEFARLSLGKNFKPISLERMRALRPDIFEKAGV